MPRNAKPLQQLARIAAGLFVVAVLLYAFGAIRVYINACDHLARSVAMVAVALGTCGAALLATVTVAAQTAASWLTLLGMLFLLLAMYLGVSATVPVGCPVV